MNSLLKWIFNIQILNSFLLEPLSFILLTESSLHICFHQYLSWTPRPQRPEDFPGIFSLSYKPCSEVLLCSDLGHTNEANNILLFEELTSETHTHRTKILPQNVAKGKQTYVGTNECNNSSLRDVRKLQRGGFLTGPWWMRRSIRQTRSARQEEGY